MKDLEKLSREEWERILPKLDQQEGEILKLRYGLEDGLPRKPKFVARVFNIPRQQVLAIERKALKALKP